MKSLHVLKRATLIVTLLLVSIFAVNAAFVGPRRALMSVADAFINPPQFTSVTALGLNQYTIPSWAASLDIEVIQPGAGGGSGARKATGGIRTGGGGGAGGGISRQIIPVSAFGSPGSVIPVYIGAGGDGGASLTADGQNGGAGFAGQAAHGCGVGAAWDYIGVPATATFNGLVAHSGLWVAVGGSGNIWTTATPAIASSWTQRTSNAGASQLNTVLFAAGLYVASGGGGTIVTSPDGITWTAQTSGTANSITDMMYDGTTFIGVGSLGTIITSTDAATWATNAFTSAANIRQIEHNGTSLYVAVDDQGHTISTTNPTGTWAAVLLTADTAHGLWGIAKNLSNLWIINAASGVIYTSADGSIWANQGTLFASVSNNQRMIFVNGYFFLATYISTDGLVWYPQLAANLGSGSKGVQYDSSTHDYYFAWGGVTQPTGSIGLLATINGSIPSYAFGAVATSGAGVGGTTAAAAGGSASTAFVQFAGGAGGASSSTAGGGSGSSTGASGGGGSGGSADAANVNRAPGSGGQAGAISGVALLSGPAGVAGGAGPGPSLSTLGSKILGGAAGGSGGAFNAATAGQAGAAGGSPGGGGGGGGASDNGNNSGAGGSGGNCEIRITARAS